MDLLVDENSPGLMKIRGKLKLAVSPLYQEDYTQVKMFNNISEKYFA
jgi:hypothetical protein